MPRTPVSGLLVPNSQLDFETGGLTPELSCYLMSPLLHSPQWPLCCVSCTYPLSCLSPKIKQLEPEIHSTEAPFSPSLFLSGLQSPSLTIRGEEMVQSGKEDHSHRTEGGV